jgi:hypothetical protein
MWRRCRATPISTYYPWLGISPSMSSLRGSLNGSTQHRRQISLLVICPPKDFLGRSFMQGRRMRRRSSSNLLLCHKSGRPHGQLMFKASVECLPFPAGQPERTEA